MNFLGRLKTSLLELFSISPQEWLLILFSVTGSFAGGANTVIIPLYLNSAGFSPPEIGLLISGQFFISLTSSFLLSLLADAYGRKKTITVARVTSLVALIMLLSGNPYGTMLLGVGGFGGQFGAILAERSSHLERSYSLVLSLQAFSAVAGALLPSFLTFNQIFLSEIALNFVAIVLISLVKEHYKGSRKVSPRISSAKTVGKLSVQSFIGIGGGIVLPLMPLWFLLKFNAVQQQVSLVFASYQLVVALVMLFAPFLGERLGKVRAIVYTQAVSIALLMIIPLSPIFILASSLFVVRQASMNMTNPLYNSMVMKMVPEEERARAASYINLLDSIPRAFGPILTGYLFGQGDLFLSFYIAAIFYSISTLLFFVFFKNTRI
jgi:MFS family permease